MKGYENSKNGGQLEELLLLTEQMQEELDRKDCTIGELKMQLAESLTLNERLNSENRAGNIQVLKDDLKKAEKLLQNEKEKRQNADAVIMEYQGKLREAEKERDFALSHQKKVEVPVEKPVPYEKCRSCDRTAYQKAKIKYDTQKKRLEREYKTKTAVHGTTMFLLAWYSLETACFQAARSEVFRSDLVHFFSTLFTAVQMAAVWIFRAGEAVAQISGRISGSILSGFVYWLILILVIGGCVTGIAAGAVFAGIWVIRLYKDHCRDVVTILVTLESVAFVLYFGDVIKKVLPVNLLLLLLIVQAAYAGIRWYVDRWRRERGYY